MHTLGQLLLLGLVVRSPPSFARAFVVADEVRCVLRDLDALRRRLCRWGRCLLRGIVLAKAVGFILLYTLLVLFLMFFAVSCSFDLAQIVNRFL